MWFLLAFACTSSAPPDSGSSGGDDTYDIPDQPKIHIAGRWWLDEGELLPNEKTTWCQDLKPDKFPGQDLCFGAVQSCTQGVAFDSNGATLLYDFQAESCDTGGGVTEFTPTLKYGGWSFVRNDDDDGDVYLVNAKEWTVDALDILQLYLQATYADLTFHLTKEGAPPRDTGGGDTDTDAG